MTASSTSCNQFSPSLTGCRAVSLVSITRRRLRWCIFTPTLPIISRVCCETIFSVEIYVLTNVFRLWTFGHVIATVEKNRQSDCWVDHDQTPRRQIDNIMHHCIEKVPTSYRRITQQLLLLANGRIKPTNARKSRYLVLDATTTLDELESITSKNYHGSKLYSIF